MRNRAIWPHATPPRYHARMMKMTLTGPRLSACLHPELRGKAVYGLAAPFQVSPTHAAMTLNLRAVGVPIVDLEAGNDLIVFDSLDAIRPEAVIPLDRCEPAVDPKTGERVNLVKYPPSVGFIPLGATLPDGSPHPHAGTGFGIGQSLGFPVERSVHQPYNQRYIQTFFDLFQFAFDGKRFSITSSKRYTPETLLPGWRTRNRAIGPGVPDGADLLIGYVAAPPGGVHGSGVARFRRTADGWAPVGFTPVTPCDTSFEPSLVRDGDGSLLFTARGWGIEGVPADVREKLDPSLRSAIPVWRSTDGGGTWTKLFQADGVRPWSPLVINPTASGTPYVSGNRIAAPWDQVRGSTTPDARMREFLSLWPLNKQRTGLEREVTVLDAVARFGKAPSGLTWYMDHPIGAVLRLKDGKRHNIMAFRICDSAEVVSDAPPSEHTGTWVEEITEA